MKLTVTNETNNLIISVDIPGSLTLADFKAYLEAETDISPQDQILRHNAKTLSGSDQSLQDSGIQDDDLILLLKLSTTSSNNVSSSSSGSARSDNSTNASAGVDFQVEAMRQQFLGNQQLKNQLQMSKPELYNALENPSEFKRLMMDSLLQYQNDGSGLMMPGGGGGVSPQQQAELRRLQDDPDNPESQAKIMEIIRQQQVDENMQLAYDISPESFTSVHMLYIKIKVNNVPVQAFVDSGAQTTIISPKLAEKVGIDRLIDRRFQGEARGVGSQKIEGKIHSVPISIGDSTVEIPCSFLVLDTHVDLLFGLDMLRRHKCLIDLQNDKLVVGGNIETKFLQELEIENNEMFGGAAGGGSRLGGNSSGFGGNIFSDTPAANSSSTSLPKKNPSSAAADAAAKRQNTGNSPQSGNFKEEDIQQLMGLGFPRDQVIKALQQCQGSVEIAASLLFQ